MRVLYVTSDYVYINEDGRVVRKELSFEKGIVTSSLGYKNVLNISFKLPKVSKDMLDVEVEKYLFSEASLDYTKEYKIVYVYQEFNDFYHIDAFVVEVNVLKKEFKKFLKIFKYIDFISFKPFVFKAFYDITKQPFKNDIFIYFDKDEAFMSCFVDGEFVFVKSLNKLSILANELNISIDELIELLSKNGLKKEAYEDDVYLKIEKFFSEFFMKVNNLISYSINYYGFSKIDRIFIYTSFEIPNLIENYQSFWDLSGIEFKKYVLNTDYDYFDYTALIYNSKYYTNEKENFSIFKRPLPFYKRNSGIFAILFLVGVSVILIDAFFKYRIIANQEKEIEVLQKRLSLKQKEVKFLKDAIKKYQEEIKKFETLNKNIQTQIDDIYQKILALSKIEFKKPFSNVMADLAQLLKKYNLKVYSFKKDNNHIEITIATTFNNSYKIAKFLKELHKKGYKNVESSNILNNGEIYISKVSYDE